MKIYLKSVLITLAVVLVILAAAKIAYGAPTSTPVINLFITGLSGNGTKCLQIDNTGLVAVAGAACGSGGGGSLSGGVTGTIPFWINSSTLSNVAGLNFATSSGVFSAPSSSFTNVSTTNLTASTYIQLSTLNGLLYANNGNILATTTLYISTSTWVINSSGTIIQIVNQGGSSTIGINPKLSNYTNDAGFLTTSTWTIQASGTNIFFLNSNGSTTGWVNSNPTFNNVSSTRGSFSTSLDTGGLQYTNASGTNESLTGYIKAANGYLTSVSSTNITTTGYVTINGTTLNTALGALTFNGTPIINGGAQWVSAINQTGQASNGLILQNATATAVLGNVILGGGVGYVTSTRTLGTSTANSDFCGGGLFVVTSTTGDVNITFPTIAAINSSTCGPIVGGNWSPQYVVNNSTNTLTQIGNGPGYNIYYTPGTPTVLAPGQEWFEAGQFISSGPSSTFNLNVFGLSTSSGPYPSSSMSFVQYGDRIFGGNASGTWIGIDAKTNVTGLDFVNFQVASATKFSISDSGVASTTELRSPSSTLTNIFSTNVSTTNLSAVTYLQTAGLAFTNASGTNATLTGYLQITGNKLFDAGGNKYVTSTAAGTGTVTTSTSCAQCVAFFQAGNGTFLEGLSTISISTSTGVFTAGSSSLTNISSTRATFATSIDTAGIIFTNGTSTGTFNAASSTFGTSTLPANGLAYFASSSPIFFIGNQMTVGIGTSTPSKTFVIANSSTAAAAFSVDTNTSNPNYLLDVQNSSSLPLFRIASSGIISIVGSSTANTIGGSSLAAGACTSTVIIFKVPLSTTTDQVVVTPQIYPGNSTIWRGYINIAGAATSSVTAEVCEAVLGTPTASKYNVSIFRDLNN